MFVLYNQYTTISFKTNYAFLNNDTFNTNDIHFRRRRCREGLRPSCSMYRVLTRHVLKMWRFSTFVCERQSPHKISDSRSRTDTHAQSSRVTIARDLRRNSGHYSDWWIPKVDRAWVTHLDSQSRVEFVARPPAVVCEILEIPMLIISSLVLDSTVEDDPPSCEKCDQAMVDYRPLLKNNKDEPTFSNRIKHRSVQSVIHQPSHTRRSVSKDYSQKSPCQKRLFTKINHIQ